MTWKPGQSGNPGGRPGGSRNIRTIDIFRQLKERGDADPAEYLSGQLTKSEDHQERRECAVALLPYIYSKNASRVDPQFIEEKIQLPAPSNIKEGYQNIAHIQGLYAEGLISGITHDRLMASTRAIIDAFAVEQKLLDLQEQNGQLRQIISITGGLPPLPGTNVEMPLLESA